MAKSVVRAPSSRKGRKVRAPDELASEYQRNRFFDALEKAVVFNIGDAAEKANLPVSTVKTLLRDDPAFARRVEDIRERHREAFKKAVADRGMGSDGRAGDPALLKLYGQIVFPEVMQETKAAVNVNVTVADVKSMTTDELIALRDKLAKRG